MHKLKKGQEAFEVVDGPFAGRRFVKDQTYAEVPDNERHRFQRVQEPKPAKAKKGTKTETK